MLLADLAFSSNTLHSLRMITFPDSSFHWKALHGSDISNNLAYLWQLQLYRFLFQCLGFILDLLGTYKGLGSLFQLCPLYHSKLMLIHSTSAAILGCYPMLLASPNLWSLLLQLGFTNSLS